MKDTKWENIIARKNMIKTCPHCGKQHTISKKGDSRWCSEECFRAFCKAKRERERKAEIAQAISILKKYGLITEKAA